MVDRMTKRAIAHEKRPEGRKAPLAFYKYWRAQLDSNQRPAA